MYVTFHFGFEPLYGGRMEINMNEQKLCSLLVGGVSKDFNREAELQAVYEQYGNNKIYDIAKKRKIIPFCAKSLEMTDGEYWHGIIEEYRKRNQNIISFLDKAYAALDKFSANKIFVSENFGALLLSGNDIGLFASGDIDNYAPISEKDKIYKAMRSIGCDIKERYAVNNQIAAEFFPPKEFELPEKFYFSVDFYPLARLKLPCFIDPERFIKWEECTRYKDTAIRLANPTSLMYICLMHVSLHSFLRAPDYRLYVDLYNLACCDIDYKLIDKWAGEEQTVVRKTVSAYISNKLMCTNIPVSDIKRAKRLIKYVYDENTNQLYPEPNVFKVSNIDIMCNDKSNLFGACEILFPDKAWMKKTYKSTSLGAYLRHFKRIF